MLESVPRLVRIPAIIDPHVHCRDFGQSQKETYETAANAAAAGGVTFIGDMPNNSDLTDNLEKILQKKEKISGLRVDFGFYLGTLGDEKQNFKECWDEVMGLKIYMGDTTGGFIVEDKEKLDKIFRKWEVDKPILVHTEGKTLETAIELAEKYDRLLYICHVSRKEEIKMIEKAKDKRPGKVFAEVTPHHLFLDSVSSKDPFRQMKPPLASTEDIHYLWKAVKDGIIDTVGSDHAPHTIREKISINPPSGVPGLETTLLMLLEAEDEGIISRRKIIELTHGNPIRIFGIKGQENSFLDIETDEPWRIGRKNLETKCGWTPFEGTLVHNMVIRTVLRGKEIHRNKNYAS